VHGNAGKYHVEAKSWSELPPLPHAYPETVDESAVRQVGSAAWHGIKVAALNMAGHDDDSWEAHKAEVNKGKTSKAVEKQRSKEEKAREKADKLARVARGEGWEQPAPARATADVADSVADDHDTVTRIPQDVAPARQIATHEYQVTGEASVATRARNIVDDIDDAEVPTLQQVLIAEQIQESIPLDEADRAVDEAGNPLDPAIERALLAYGSLDYWRQDDFEQHRSEHIAELDSADGLFPDEAAAYQSYVEARRERDPAMPTSFEDFRNYHRKQLQLNREIHAYEDGTFDPFTEERAWQQAIADRPRQGTQPEQAQSAQHPEPQPASLQPIDWTAEDNIWRTERTPRDRIYSMVDFINGGRFPELDQWLAFRQDTSEITWNADRTQAYDSQGNQVHPDIANAAEDLSDPETLLLPTEGADGLPDGNASAFFGRIAAARRFSPDDEGGLSEEDRRIVQRYFSAESQDESFGEFFDRLQDFARDWLWFDATLREWRAGQLEPLHA
jgi:hypothetical protein